MILSWSISIKQIILLLHAAHQSFLRILSVFCSIMLNIYCKFMMLWDSESHGQYQWWQGYCAVMYALTCMPPSKQFRSYTLRKSWLSSQGIYAEKVLSYLILYPSENFKSELKSPFLICVISNLNFKYRDITAQGLMIVLTSPYTLYLQFQIKLGIVDLWMYQEI